MAKRTNLTGAALAIFLFASVFSNAERLPIKIYTVADGLPSDHIDRIIMDRRGFLWLGTPEGLSRFDGYKFVNYSSQQGFAGRGVNDILEDRDGTYWIASWTGLWRMNVDPPANGLQSNAKRFVPYYPSADPLSRSILSVCQDKAGVIWCGTSKGLYRLDKSGSDWKFSYAGFVKPGVNNDLAVRFVFPGPDGSLYACAPTGLYRHKPDGKVENYSPKDGMPLQYAMFVDNDHHVWAATTDGLRELEENPRPGKFIAKSIRKSDGLAQQAVFAGCQTADGMYWIATPLAVNTFRPTAPSESVSIQTYNAENGLTSAGITDLLSDRNGNIWLATTSSGLLRIAGNGFRTYTEADGLSSRGITSIFTDNSGNLCALTGRASVDRFDGRRFHPTSLTLPSNIHMWGWGWNQVTFQDSAGQWWMSTAEGLVRYPKLEKDSDLTNAKPLAIYNKTNQLPSSEIFRLYEDSRHDIWISSLGNPNGTCTRWERATETFHRYSPKDGFPIAAPTAFREDRSGNVWIGIYAGGIVRYSKGSFTHFSEADGVPHGLIEDLFLDDEGRMWIATNSGGIARVDNPAAERPLFVRYTKDDGLSSNQADCITEDRWGEIYIGTGLGVDRLDPESGRIKHFTTADGLPSSLIDVAYRQKDGTLWFGTEQGLTHYSPRHDEKSDPPPIFINALRISGVDYPVSEIGATSITLPDLAPTKNDVQIEFAGISLAAGETLRYQYRLDGASNQWSKPTDQRAVNYPNLPPGTYRFFVKALSTSGTSSVSPALVSFTVLRPIWQRWWFITSIILLVGLAAYLIDRYRVMRLIELERVRTRIATDLHDDIGASLSRMAILSEVVKQQTTVGDGKSAGMLNEIADSARGLVDSMSDIVWSIDPSKDDLTNVLMRVRAFASDVLEPCQIHWELLAPHSLEKVKLSPDQRRHLFLIFKEAINNIAKHSGCKNVKMTLTVSHAELAAQIDDDGKGMPGTSQGGTITLGGNGLKNMAKRAREMGGSLTVESNEGKGTRLKITAHLK